MSTEKLKLEVLLAAIDKVSAPFKAIAKGSSQTAKALKEAKAALKDLNDAQGRIDGFRKTSKDAAITANQLKAAQQRVKQLKAEMAGTSEPSRQMTRAMAAARQEVSQYGMRLDGLLKKKERLRAELVAANVPLNDLKKHQADLATRIASTTAEVSRQTEAMKKQNGIAARMHAARAEFNKTLGMGKALRTTGMAVGSAGAAIGLPVGMAVKEFASFEDAMLGVARQVDGARDANGKLTATYYEMGDAIKAMSERIPMAAADIAAIVEAGARMGIQGKENLLTYTETTAVMAEAFKLPVDQIGENIGKISQLYKIPIKDVKGLGDAINWLDDNALSKGGDIVDVLQRVAGAATLVNMSYKDAAALGSSFLTSGATSDTAGTATNALIGQLANAPMLATAKRYRGGLEMLGLDAKSLQSGMVKDATGTILKVLDAIKRLPQEKQLEAATRLFGKEYADDVSKLAQNLDEYRRQLGLVNAEAAKGSMQREADARKDALNARLLMAKNALSNVASDLGEKLKPALVESLEKTLSIIQAVRDWTKENPALASGLMTVAKWAAIIVSGLGALLMVAGGILVPIAAMNFGLAAFGLTGKAAALGIWAVLKPVLLVAGAFYAGYKAGELLNEGLNALVSWAVGYETTLGSALFDLVEKVRELPAKMRAAAGQMIDGLITGIKERWQALKDTVTGTAADVLAWFKGKLGIRSPSRAFAAIGGYAMQGLEQGILRGQGGALAAMAKASRNLIGAGAGVLVAGGAAAMPVTSPGSAASSSMVVQITIYAAPGMDTQDLSRQMVAEIRKYEAERAARGRSSMRDRD